MLPWQLQRKKREENKPKEKAENIKSKWKIQLPSQLFILCPRLIMHILAGSDISGEPVRSREVLWFESLLCWSVASISHKRRNTVCFQEAPTSRNSQHFGICILMRQFGWAGQSFLLITHGCCISKVCLHFFINRVCESQQATFLLLEQEITSITFCWLTVFVINWKKYHSDIKTKTNKRKAHFFAIKPL